MGVTENGKYHEIQESPQPAAFLSLSQNEQSYTIFVVRSHRAQKEMAAERIDIVNGLAISAPDKDKILWRNAERFFNLNGIA